ncbi:UvrD-helicase domain-containing protein [Solimonas terrae]|uniref:DNA 3'-5' helicase n=1 Tax=Solimonas terrae TaxID=1396819 RepID=A0A6M2BR18_9GAMM|nr:UvrD-helicase domain-containing protein [Solimonas terrae]NGY04477.1 UvrD-helicase domain-containing protein [Solimonas terrae]
MSIADAAARARALDPRGSFIVQAPAGSGKTELLTQRLLVLLATADEPEEIVAITFTRKAAAEMRARVFRAIRDAANAVAPEDAHKAQTWQLASAALARSRSRGWQLEDNPQRLRVMTIDALCMQITQQMPLTAGFGGRVQIADEAEPLYREAARATLDALEAQTPYRDALVCVLRHFDNRTALLEDQLVALLGRRDQWLHFATEGGRQARAELEAALQEVVGSALLEADAAIASADRTAWLASAAHASAQRLAEQPTLDLHALRDGVWPPATAAQLPRWLALLDLVLTRTDGWRKRLDKNVGFPAGKTRLEKEQLDPPRDAHLELIAALSSQAGLLERLQDLRRLPAAAYDDAQWRVLQALLDVLRLAAAQLRVVFAAHGQVDFAEVAAKAVDALGGDEAPSELALAFDYRIRHLLVDEFQDTSGTQYELLKRLTAGWQAGDGRSLFVVGDPMQSIYRFREADVGLYLRARRNGIAQLQLQTLQLQCNFRSRAGVVDWVNAAFAQVLPAQEDAGRSAVPYSAAIATREAEVQAAVCVHPRFDNDARAEAREVVGLIAQARAEQADGSIAVLVRSRTHLDELMPALRSAGLRYQAVDLESLSSRPVIEDLRALTRALLQPMDRVAWLAILRAPWCGLRLADLLVLSDGLSRDAPLLDSLRDEARRARTSGDGRARLTRTMAVLEATLAQQGRKPLRRWIESAWLALGGPAAVREARDLVDAQQFFAKLESLARGAGLDDLDALDLALRNLKATADPLVDGRLSLMTIHKAKGLEFDTVIVPGLGRRTRSDTPPPIVFSRRAGLAGDAQLVLAPIQARGDQVDPTYDFIRQLETDKQRFEDGRLLYVAATRARRRLHLLGAVGLDDEGVPRPPAPSSLLARLWPAVEARFVRAAADRAPPQPAPSASLADERMAPPPLRRFVAGWTAPTLPQGLSAEASAAIAAAPRFEWAGEIARATGTVFHRWAERLARDGLEAWDRTRLAALAERLPDELWQAGVPRARCEAASTLVHRAMRSLLDDARGRWLFDPAHRQARSEWALTALVDGVPRQFKIDRSFIDADGTRWIVDFKTSRHEGGDLQGFLDEERRRYEAQLCGYAAVLRRYGPQPVRAALYLPLIDDAARRWQVLDL